MKRFAVLFSLMTLISFCFVSLAAARDNANRLAGHVPDPIAQQNDDADEKQADETEDSDSDEDAPADEAEEKDADAAKGEAAEKSDNGDDEAEEKAADASAESKEKAAAEKSDEETEAKKETKKRKTHKVEPKRLKVEVALEGVFVASETKEVPLRPDAWTSFEIVDVVDHGKKVRAGETLITFDSEKIDEAIEDLELDQRLNELAIRRAEQEMPRMEKTLKMNLEQAERANREAQEDFERYNEIDRPMQVKMAEFMVKYYDFMLDYERDELEQLEKMYEADDLTEETEEIVLKRQRNSVEFAEFSSDYAKVNRDETLKVRLPRYDIRIKEALERAEMALARARMALSIDLNSARYELEQRKMARTKSLDRHVKLLADRDLMEIKSPVDGIVFYGQCVNGRWSETPSLINKYKPHNNVSPGSVLMTIVEPRPISILSNIEESKRPEVAEGQKAVIALPADGSDRLDGEVESISSIPVSPGKFEVEVNLDQDSIPEWVVAGMTCKIQVQTYDNKQALTVPKAAVHDDEDDVNQKYVWLVDPEDEEAKPTRRNVTLGKRSGDDIEIAKGLKKGDVVSLEDESEKAKDDE